MQNEAAVAEASSGGVKAAVELLAAEIEASIRRIEKSP
jgi:hypothetical protein